MCASNANAIGDAATACRCGIASRASAILICALSALLLTACGGPPPAPEPLVQPVPTVPVPRPCTGNLAGTDAAGAALQRIRILARDNANRGEPVALDIIFIYDPALLAELPRDAGAWFQRRDAIRLLAGGGLQVVSLAIAPGSGPAHIDLPEDASLVHRVLAYPLYHEPAAQRVLELTRFHSVRLTFEENTVTMCRE